MARWPRGIRYIDDVALHMRDANYYVVMTVDDAGRGSERIFYQAFGEPQCYSFGDGDGDHTIDGRFTTGRYPHQTQTPVSEDFRLTGH